MRVVPLSARAGTDEPGFARCPVRLAAAARGRVVRLTIRCPRGCHARVRLEGRRGTARLVRLRAGGRGTVRLSAGRKGRSVWLRVDARHRTGPASQWRREIPLPVG